MRKREKKVLWGFLYVLIFFAVFALSAVFKIKYNPLNEKYSVDWNDSVGTIRTDLSYGEKKQTHLTCIFPLTTAGKAMAL